MAKEMLSAFLFCFVALLVDSWEFPDINDWKNIQDELKTLKVELQQVKAVVDTTKMENDIIRLQNKQLQDKNTQLEKRVDQLTEDTQKLKATVRKWTSKSNTTQYISLDVDQQIGQNRRNVKREIAPVGFSAVLNHNVILGPNQAILFDSIITNIGSAYDARDGMFTAPIMGLYMFSTTICSEAQLAVHVELVKNGVQLAAIYGDDYDLGTQTVIVQLNENDKVWVRHFIDSGPGHINNESNRHYTTFSGAIITAL